MTAPAQSHNGYYLLGDAKELQELSPHGRRRQLKRVLAVLATFAVVGWAFLNFTSSPDQTDYSGSENAFEALGSMKKCSSDSSRPPPASPPSPVNFWASLTVAETAEIQSWLEDPARELNLSRAASSSSSDNIVYLIETFYPPKAEVLAHLADPDTVDRPTRRARVTIHHGGQKDPTVKDYLVGPLPVGNETKMEELTSIYHRDIPYNARGFVNLLDLEKAWKAVPAALRDAMEDLFDATVRGTEADTLITVGGGPYSFDGSFRRVWVTFKKNVPGSWLHAIGFYLYLDVGGTDSSQWKALKVVYNNQFFDSVGSFLEAYQNGTLERYPPSIPSSDSWSSRKRVGERRDLDDLPGPRAVSFAGLRFRVDKERQYVSWMGWGMYLGFDRDMGLSLWDIRFKGERIIYQLAPQEALARYAGNDPVQSTTAWQDRHFGMGEMVLNMLPGYDCPHTAIYLPATTRTPSGSITVDKAICVFEHDTERPLTRHTGFVDGEFGAVKGSITSSNSTVPSKSAFQRRDIFKVAFGTPGRTHMEDAFEIRAWVMSTTIVDFDIAGTKNSLLETTTHQEEVEHPWLDDDDWGYTTVQQKVTKRYIESEDEALLKYPHNFQGHYAIVNQDNKNAWGYPRGYIVHAGLNPVHTGVVGSKRTLENAHWARYNLAVSKRKETEPSSSSMWNMNLPGAPVVNFHKLFDGDNITQEDLVVWVNVGTHHLPQAEDSPNTKMNTATSSFLLTPFNYFDYDVSMESSNAILLTSPKIPGEPFAYDDYGVEQGYTCVPEAPPPFEYFLPIGFSEEGSQLKPTDPEEMRRMSETYHRVRVDLRG
ncbi:hypothetical protein PQX77_002470 [Marasmius sp. AFHP31]|nr:hypothetical protein PQX77_002470 [Marasmius sp. AFHP31]